jgi:ribose transport system substrate-binding protein
MNRNVCILLMAAIVGLISGCNRPAEAPKQPAAAEKIRIGFVARAANDYWSLVRFGCDTAVLTLGNVELDFRTPAGKTAGDQNEVLSNLVASGVQAIAISPIDGGEQTAALDALSANTLLVCADNDAAQSHRAAYVGTDNVAAGLQAAGLLKAALPHGGKISLLVGSDLAQNARDRIAGIKQGLAGAGIEIVDTLVDGMSPNAALENAQKTLSAHPDLTGMVGLYSYDGPAILAALRVAGKSGQVKIVCFDALKDTLDGIQSGEIQGAVVQNPYKIGNRTVELMVKSLRGDKSALGGGKIFIPSQVVTSENVKEYIRFSAASGQ